MPRTVFGSVCLLAAALAASSSIAGSREMPGMTPEALFPDARFDPAIPTQEQVLGVPHGSRPLRHAELMLYLEKLAEVSPRVDRVFFSVEIQVPGENLG